MCNTRADINWQLQRDRFAFLFWLCQPRSCFTPSLTSLSLCTHRAYVATSSQLAGYLCILCAKPLVLVSGLRFLETFRRHPALVFAFAGLTPIPAPTLPPAWQLWQAK